jgi:hypothetical protein
MNEAQQVDAARVLAIIQEENPAVFQLAVRRAIIEQQNEVIEQMKAALGAPLDGTVPSPLNGSQ